ncbi:DNA polymerase/3'-5' exonuclease PolX [Bradyrhizobium sp. AUGA SZCCT0283]|uniref:DNA polymerase/3'-5' exonuclease PolX n=1 Tax=Bradyrhizobium sp. AUGA SZCCT0283 TaxID=2807671 RepID=UPI001BADDC04|nr:DNA polymerase/3'-5' exonuclease PolX [Bradyrhizobium sp. AUGA SZCCT0283]MBR1279228.1 DNA polymerase/3'-5' exonuclease PolX [Bradyrhizobium sp. AUGA SZCCT0283]
MPVQNAEIAAMFDQAAELLEIGGENQFRVRAYRRAAREIEGLPKAVASLLKSGGDLSELPGIGKDLAGKIADIVKTGHFGLLDTLKKKLPGELGEMAALPGLGPKRIKLLYDKLKVRTLNDLRQAIKTGRLRELRGFGPVIEKKLLGALEKPQPAKRFKLSVAEAEAEALVGFLRDRGRVVVAGSYRRRRDTVGDLDVLVTAKNGAAVGNRLVEYDNVAQVVAHGSTRTTVMLRSGLQVDVRAVPEESYGAALLYFTGSKAHNIALRGLANQYGWKLNEYGLFSGQRRIAGATEEDVYEKLKLAYIVPELREDHGEIAAAQAGKLPRLVKLSDVRGDLHVHSDWTDGTVTIAEMATAAQARGYEYIALTDHSRRVAMTHGLDPARLARQIHEIDRLNEKLKNLTILRGIEVDILRDGSLDLPDSSLAKLDIVVAAVHSHFDLPRQAQTERVVRAMENRHVSILAHPTGRLIGEREPYDIDMDLVISAARKAGCYLEINAEPDRLDLNDLHAHAAKLAGVKLAVSTDAHSIDAFECMRFGIDQARRAWLTANDVLNTRPLAELRKLLKR